MSIATFAAGGVCVHATLLFAAAALAAALAVTAFAGELRPDSPMAAKRFDAWKVIGPGGGGAQFYPAISPHDANKVYVCSDMSQGFVSEDGGESWRMFNLRTAIRFFVCDPVEPDTVYAKTSALWRSRDGGRTWELVHPAPADVKEITILEDHAWERVDTKDGGTDSVAALAVDTADSKRLFAVMLDGDSFRLAVSPDAGESWSSAGALPAGGSRVFVDPASPPAERTVYVAGRDRISVLEGGRWTHHAPPEGAKSLTAVAAAFPGGAKKPIIYAVSGSGWNGDGQSVAATWVSRDGGATWRRVDAGIAEQLDTPRELLEFQTVDACPTRPELAYVSYKVRGAAPGKLPQYMGVAKTTDAGESFELVWKDTTVTPGPGMHDAWMNERFGPEWGENPFSIDISASDPDVVYATDFGRTMRTTDGGKTWRGVYSKKLAQGDWTSTGLDMTTCYGVHRDPFEPDRIWIDYTDIGAFVSDDGGVSWHSGTADGVPEGWVNTTYWMVFDPMVKGRVWAVMTYIHDLPFAKMWKHNGIAHYNGGVCMSEDGGRTWRRSTEGMPETACTHVLMDPTSPADARVLYVTGFATGLWKSTDSGRSWTLKNNGIVGEHPFAWRTIRDKNGVLYLIVARRSYDGSCGTEYDGALYRSRDDAESWERIALPEGVNGPNGLAVDPDDPKRLYLAVWGRYDPQGDRDGGILLSTDAGATWKNIFSKQQHVYEVTIDPNDSDVLYAGTMSSRVWRSVDRGATWKAVKGYNFKQAKRVLVDEADPGKIFVTTFGGSVWYGPAEGDPDAPEDIATPVMKLPE